MSAIKHRHAVILPGRFEALVHCMPPQAITDEAQYDNTVGMIDRLTAVEDLTKGQAIYLETLVQLVQNYEASHLRIRLPKGIDALRHVLEEHSMNASDLARILGVHVSMGSKILKGDRALTVDHLKRLAAKFKVRPDTFID